MKTTKQYGVLLNVLKKLEFFQNEGANPEIVFVENQSKKLHPKHYIALEFAKIFEADAVFFRYYEDNRFCVPQIYFYDNTINSRSKNDIAEIHKRVYSSCQVPIICFVDKTEIYIYDCRLPVEQISETEISNKNCLFAEDDVETLSKISKYFTAKNLNYGLFWETEESSKHFLNNKSAYENLVNELSKIRDEVIKDCQAQKFDENFAENILFKCILIKYLEENGKEEAEKFYKRKGLTYKSVSDFITEGKLLELFDVLEKHFNGNVFGIANKEERKYLENKKLPELAKHLDGYLEKGNQLTIWQIYSFKDIPIELISNFYEEFIPNDDANKGTVYTPSFLVNLLIDECLPLSNKKEDKNYNLKIIDPSCGSGIFVSSAFKRLVQRYRLANGKNGKPLDKNEIELTEIKKILSTCIYGVDKNATAVKLTNFSLQLALCQAVPNNVLWNWTKGKVFNSLTENIYENDFFDFLVNEKQLLGTFDLVIGNPPFEKLEPCELNNIYSKLAIQEKPILISTTDNTKKQIAVSFLETSIHLLKQEIGKSCLILPAGEILYFNESFKFRNKFFKKYNIPQILDFTLLRRKLFSNNKEERDTTVPVIALFIDNKKPNNESIQHIVIRRTQKSKEKIYFEIDHYDFYDVSKEWVEKELYCWKANLYGGNRVLDLINKFYGNNSKQKVKRLESYLKEKSIKRTKGLHQIQIKKSIKNGKFPDLKPQGKEAIILSSIQKNTLDDFINNYLLNTTLQPINNFFIATTSGRQGLRGAYTILDSDFYNIPYINIEKINALFSTNELIIINDVANYKIEEFGDGENAPINQPITTTQTIQTFGEVYSNELNTIYKKKNKEYKVEKIIEGNSFYACQIIYTSKEIKQPKFDKSEVEINNLLQEQVGTNTVYNKIMRIFKDNGNKIIFIKPKIIRYWLKSIALRDADDTFDLIIEKGMN